MTWASAARRGGDAKAARTKSAPVGGRLIGTVSRGRRRLTGCRPQRDKHGALFDLSPLLLAATVTAGPPAGQAILDAAQSMQVRGRSFAADKGYGRLGREAPQSYDGHLAWAEFLVSEGRGSQALGPAGVTSRLAPYDAAPYAARAAAHLEAGQGDHGRNMLDKALEMDPWSPDALLALARALRRSGDLQGEARVLKRAAAVAGADPRVERAAALSALRRGDEAEASVRVGKLATQGTGVTPTLVVADVYLAARRPHAALKVLQPAVAAHGANPRLMRALGRALLAAGAPPLRAAAAFRAAMNADPDDADAAVGFALALAATLPDDARGAADLAVRTLSGVLNSEPGHVGALLAQAHIARALGDPAGAYGWASKVPETHPAKPEADNIRALTRLDREDPYGAAKILREILSRRPELRHVRLNLALALLKAGRSTDARTAADEAIAGLAASHPLVAYAQTLGGATPGAK